MFPQRTAAAGAAALRGSPVATRPPLCRRLRLRLRGKHGLRPKTRTTQWLARVGGLRSREDTSSFLPLWIAVPFSNPPIRLLLGRARSNALRQCVFRQEWCASHTSTLAFVSLTDSSHARRTGKCCANIRTDDLDLEHPRELLNLDVMHKRSTGRNVETVSYGRFTSAPRSERPATLAGAHTCTASSPQRLLLLLRLAPPHSSLRCYSVHPTVVTITIATRYPIAALPRTDFFGDEAIKRSNHSLPSRLFLDPYHVADGSCSALQTLGVSLVALAGPGHPAGLPCDPSPQSCCMAESLGRMCALAASGAGSCGSVWPQVS